MKYAVSYTYTQFYDQGIEAKDVDEARKKFIELVDSDKIKVSSEVGEFNYDEAKIIKHK
jgi:hypothetical protein